MDIIELARQLGAAIQKEDAYVAYRAAKEANDADEKLQALIGEFNLQRMSLATELQKPEDQKSRSKIEELNNQLQKLYDQVMSNESMQKYNEAKQAMDVINTIADPELTSLAPQVTSALIDGKDTPDFSFRLADELDAERIKARDLLFSGQVDQSVELAEAALERMYYL